MARELNAIYDPGLDPILEGKNALKGITGKTEKTGIWTMDYQLDESIRLMIYFLNLIILLWLPERISMFVENSH